MNKQLAIVMGRNYTSRLGMIRAAGSVGCDVAVIQTDKLERRPKHPIDSHSRYITKGYYKANEPDTELVINVLLRNFKNSVPKPILLPTDDFTASVIDQNSNKLKEHFLFPSIELQEGRVIHYMNKAVQKELARKAGFDVADGWTSLWKDGNYQIPEGVTFPCFIKPEFSYKGASKYVMQKCDTKEQLELALSKMPGREDYPILIESFVNIQKEYDIPGLSLPGMIYTPGIIEKNEIFLGVTASGTMFPMEKYPDVEEKMKTFLEDLHFQGLVDVELFESNNRIYFNELNMRFGASGFAMTGGGVNMPEQLILSLRGENTDLSKRLSRPYTFVSEKVLLQKVAKGKISLAEYNHMVESANLRFVKNDADMQPFTAFEKSKRITLCKRLIKKIIRKK